MTPKEKLERIKKRPEYLAVAGTRRKWVTPAFILQAKPPSSTSSNPSEKPRAGFTASKKVGNAVKRSKAKRRMKEAARLLIPENGQAGWDYVFICRESSTHYPFDKLCSDIKWALVKLSSNADLKSNGRREKQSKK